MTPAASNDFDDDIKGQTSVVGQPTVTARPEQPRVTLVEGPRPRLLAETRQLLRLRLRAASMMVGLGSGLFFIWSAVTGNWAAGGDPLFVVLHALIVVVGVCGAALLSSRVPVTLAQLRLAEALIFGLPAIFMVALEFQAVSESGRADDSVIGIVPWTLLIFTYALFIPNAWQRAAIVIGLMGIAPVAAAILKLLVLQPVDAAQSVDSLTRDVLMMTIAVVVAIYGTHTISILRREAFEARKLGQYFLKRLIGAGGMGDVYLAEHHLIKRPCAIKVIRPSKAADPKVLARFEREVQATARLSHWNTVEIFDYGRTEDGTFYYVMEYLPGMSLNDLVERNGPLPPERVIHFFGQACRALAEAHAVGLIHQDIKPGNIFAAERGGVHDVVKLLDFGLALPLDDRSLATPGDDLVGSPLFMSPERILGNREPDASSDIYSLGAVAYFLLCGRPPFDGTKPIKVMVAHAHDEVQPPSHWCHDVPEKLESIVLRCLAKQPQDRYPDAKSLLAALEDCRLANEWTQERAADWWQALELRENDRLSTISR